jgi:hypothetical protein
VALWCLWRDHDEARRDEDTCFGLFRDAGAPPVSWASTAFWRSLNTVENDAEVELPTAHLAHRGDAHRPPQVNLVSSR